jgi:hypothetical protein
MRKLNGLQFSLLAVVAGCTGAGQSPPTASQTAALSSASPVSQVERTIDTAATSGPRAHARSVPVVNATNVRTLGNIEQWIVVWKGSEAIGQKMSAFNDWMLSSRYWTESMEEYGVGPGHSGLIVIPSAPPAKLDDPDLTPLIEALIANHTLPQPGANTVFAFVPPPTTISTTLDGFFQGCRDFGGYHSETNSTDASKPHVPYSINLQCPDKQGTVSFDSVTEVLSHETAEAASDPIPDISLGWISEDGQEIGDLCEMHSGSTFAPEGFDNDDDAPVYYVTRIYSNRAAKLGGSHDPCVPRPHDRPYFGAAFGNDNHVTINVDANGNGSASIDLNTFAFGANTTSSISWRAFVGVPSKKFNFFSGHNRPGEHVTLPVTVESAFLGDFSLIALATLHDGTNNEMHGVVSVRGPAQAPQTTAASAMRAQALRPVTELPARTCGQQFLHHLR